MYLIRKEDILTIAKALSSDYQIYGPAVEPLSGQTFFDQVTDLERDQSCCADPRCAA